MKEETAITIEKNALFCLIRDMKEFRQEARDSSMSILKRHDLKVEYNLLDNILKEEGLNGIFEKINNMKEKLQLDKEIKDYEDEGGRYEEIKESKMGIPE